jgi:hypothetical protein
MDNEIIILYFVYANKSWNMVKTVLLFITKRKIFSLHKMWFPISESQFKNFHATYFIFYENVITILSLHLYHLRNTSVTIVLMVMLMLVLARMLIFRTLVKRSTVHNNGNGDVNVRNDVKRSRKCLVL